MKDGPLTLQEAKTVADIFATVDKVIKLDHKEPTEIHKDITNPNPITVNELVDVIRRDPMMSGLLRGNYSERTQAIYDEEPDLETELKKIQSS
jgi:hypothetical protein